MRGKLGGRNAEGQRKKCEVQSCQEHFHNDWAYTWAPEGGTGLKGSEKKTTLRRELPSPRSLLRVKLQVDLGGNRGNALRGREDRIRSENNGGVGDLRESTTDVFVGEEPKVMKLWLE